MISGVLQYLLFFVLTYLLFGFSISLLFKKFIKNESFSNSDAFIYFFGFAPAITTLILYYFLILFPKQSIGFYKHIIFGFFLGILVLLFIYKKDKYTATNTQIKRSKNFNVYSVLKNLFPNFAFILTIFILIHIFFVGVFYPLIGHDQFVYGETGKVLYETQNPKFFRGISEYEKRGSFSRSLHAPGYALMYTWSFMLYNFDGLGSDLIGKTASPYYSLWVVILLFYFLKKKSGAASAKWATLFIMSVPFWVTYSANNHIDSPRIFFYLNSLMLLSEAINKRDYRILLASAIASGLGAFIHSIGIVITLTNIMIYLFYFDDSFDKKIKYSLLYLILALIFSGGFYFINVIKFGTPFYANQEMITSEVIYNSYLMKIFYIDTKVIYDSYLMKIFHIDTKYNMIVFNYLSLFSQTEYWGYFFYFFILLYIIKIREKKSLIFNIFAISLISNLAIILFYDPTNQRYQMTILPVAVFLAGYLIGEIRIKTIGKGKLWKLLFTELFLMCIIFNQLDVINIRENIGIRRNIGMPLKGIYLRDINIKDIFHHNEENYITQNYTQAVMFLNRNYGKNYYSLVFKRPEYFYYTNGKGIDFRSSKLDEFYKANDKYEAYNILKSLSITHIYLNKSFKLYDSFSKYQFSNIIEDKKMCRIIFKNDYVEIYELL